MPDRRNCGRHKLATALSILAGEREGDGQGDDR
jgi:hypothetical protein